MHKYKKELEHWDFENNAETLKKVNNECSLSRKGHLHLRSSLLLSILLLNFSRLLLQFGEGKKTVTTKNTTSYFNPSALKAVLFWLLIISKTTWEDDGWKHWKPYEIEIQAFGRCCGLFVCFKL